MSGLIPTSFDSKANRRRRPSICLYTLTIPYSYSYFGKSLMCVKLLQNRKQILPLALKSSTDHTRLHEVNQYSTLQT